MDPKKDCSENLNAVRYERTNSSDQNGAINDTPFSSDTMIDLHNSDNCDNQKQQQKNIKIMRSRRKFNCKCIYALAFICILNLILTAVFFAIYMNDNHGVGGYGNTTPDGCRRCGNKKTRREDNSVMDTNEVMTIHLEGIQNPTRCCPDAEESYEDGDEANSESTVTAPTETIETFVGMHVGLNHPLTDGRLEWSPPTCADSESSYKTETIHLSVDKTGIIIPQSGKYRITSQLVFETGDEQFVLTHYISYKTSMSSTHSILAKTMQTVGNTDPINSGKSSDIFTPSSLTGTFILDKGSMVGVYVSKRSIPYLFTDKEVNSFGIELISPSKSNK